MPTALFPVRRLPTPELRLAHKLHISIDEYIFKEKHAVKSSALRRVNTLLDGLNDKELIVIEGAAKGVYQLRELFGR